VDIHADVNDWGAARGDDMSRSPRCSATVRPSPVAPATPTRHARS
jgi:hypothetical protein